MEYILHIGSYKTGTSSLQKALSDNRESLQQHGVVFPKIGTTKRHRHECLRMVVCGSTPESVGMPEDWTKRFRAETADADICVLSDELFAEVDPEFFTTLIPRDRARIVMYVREPIAFIASWYQEILRNSNMTMSLRDFGESRRLPYLRVAKRWSRVYGKENLLLRRYGRDYGRWDIVSDFANVIGLKLEDAFPSLEGRVSELNPGMAGNLLFVKRLMNQFITFNENNHHIKSDVEKLKYLNINFRGKIPVDQETVKIIANRSQIKLEGLDRLFGISIIPRDMPIEAPPCPDHDKLSHDFAHIQAWAHKRKSAMVPLLDRITGMLASD